MQIRELECFMDQAIDEAKKALLKGEVPIGAIIVKDSVIIGSGYNLVESTKDISNHAEIIAIRNAEKTIGDWRLDNCYLFSTIEPCIMCTYAAILSRISTIVYGAKDSKFGGCGSIISIDRLDGLNHSIEVIDGIRETETRDLIQNFFRKIRKEKK